MKRILALLAAGVISLGLATSASAQAHSIAAGALVLQNSLGHTTTVAPSPTGTTNYTLTLPATAGSTGQVLTLDNTGAFVWAAPSAVVTTGAIMSGMTSSNMSSNGTLDYYNPNGPTTGNNTTQALGVSDMRIPRNATLSRIYVDITTAPGAGKTRTFSFYDVTQNTHIDIAITGVATSGSDLVSSISVNSGDIIDVQQVATSGSANATGVWSYQVQ
jgi:hypothetical protein